MRLKISSMAILPGGRWVDKKLNLQDTPRSFGYMDVNIAIN